MLDRRELMQAIAISGAALGAMPALAADPAPSGPPVPWDQEGFVERAGGRIHWVSMGKGPVVVMIAKLGGWVADWRLIAPYIARNYRVLAIDAPGHGGSTMCSPAPYIQTVPESAAMVRSALQEMAIDHYAFVGNSLGGCIGLVMAAMFPDDMTHLVALSASLAAGSPWSAVPKMDAQIPPGQFDAQWNPLPRDFETMNARFKLTRQIHDEMNASRAAGGRWVRASERGVFVADMPSYLPRIRAKTLLIYGETSPYRQHIKTGLSLIPHSKVETVKGSGSFTHQEQPAETAAVILPFLAS